MQRHLFVLDTVSFGKLSPQSKIDFGKPVQWEAPKLTRGSQPVAGKEMPREMLGLEKPNRKISLLSSAIKCESTREDRDVILEDAEKGQKATDTNPTQKISTVHEKKNCNPSSQTLQQGQRGKGSPALNKALSREVGLSNPPNYFVWLNTKPCWKDPLEVR